MNLVYTDIHIHTSQNPDSINRDYNWRKLVEKIRVIANGADILISLTDHNTINKEVYLDLNSHLAEFPMLHLLLGVELHIKYSEGSPAYHCHAIFKCKINSENIDSINVILDRLYPTKHVEKKDDTIPTLDKIIREFDEYDYMMLPHGGQSHATFNTAIPRGTKFDTTMERSVYYNQFDGFTARGKEKLEDTNEYFRKLGIKDFVNLITCSDNYTPEQYPSAKDVHATPFIPTWILSKPTFDGLRLALSENTRLIYSDAKPEYWAEYIKGVKLQNDFCDINADFSAGLNVIIGGSSSGKTLLVDSIVRKIKGGDDPSSFSGSNYTKFGVEGITVDNPTGRRPHYIEQNYIMQVVNSPNTLELTSIDILKSLFPRDEEFTNKVEEGIATLRRDVTKLLNCVERIEEIENEISNLSQIGRLVVTGKVQKNILESIVQGLHGREAISYPEKNYRNHITVLNEIKSFLSNNPLVSNCDAEIDRVIQNLSKAHEIYTIDSMVFDVINSNYSSYNGILKARYSESQNKVQDFQRVLALVEEYAYKTKVFKETLSQIATYNVTEFSKKVVSMGHTLDITNHFRLTRDKVVEVFNEFLKSNYRIVTYESISPSLLYKSNFSQRPKVDTYSQFIEKVVERFMSENRMSYRITTEDNKDFHSLSAGWKTSVILDLILGYEKDSAPIVIDQPEDNLATSYINDGLVKAIKKVKNSKQIILVSHNATIPMMADAQTIVYCKNENDKIVIKSAPLEGSIDNVPVLDLVAKITDGGKPSIKKRVKKYNLKKFRQ